MEEESIKENNYNLLASDMISLNRSLPDYRYPACKVKQYPDHLPMASVVAIFHNEARSTLLRTVWSIINRSPRELLKEIILVDDVSSYEYVKNELPTYVRTLPVQTNLVRTPERMGLIRARIYGAEHAKV